MYSIAFMVSGATLANANSLTVSPQMGWNSWNTFKTNISETLISNTADLLVSLGLRDAGYTYVVIDEGWQELTRDPSTDQQRVNSTLFPSGLPALSDKVHNQSLQLGIYSDAGIYDCGFYPGSWGYEELDAQTYAGWGIDYLKYDNCGQFEAATHSPYDRFAVMRDALKSSGREILYSLCSWGNQFPWFWADQVGHSYRMSGDIHLAFAEDGAGVCKTAYCLNQGYAGCSVLTIIRKMREISPFQSPGAWLDMDMLEVGNKKGGALNEAQERTHFSFWSALKSPLIIGADLGSISSSSLNILLNQDIIALNQDSLGIAVRYFPDLSLETQYQVWAGPLEGNRLVVLVLNEGQEGGTNISLPVANLAEAAWSWTSGGGSNGSTITQAMDLWRNSSSSIDSGTLQVNDVPLNDTQVYVLQ